MLVIVPHPRGRLVPELCRSIFINTARDEIASNIPMACPHAQTWRPQCPQDTVSALGLGQGSRFTFCNGVNEATPALALPLPLVRAKGGWKPLGLLGKGPFLS